MGITPRRETSPIASVTSVTNPIKVEDTGGTQIDPSTETTLLLIKTAVEIIDNFISGARGLVTEDNSASILTALQKIDDLQNALKSVDTDELIARITDSTGTEINPAKEDGNLASIKTAVELIDNFISGARGLVTEDNSGAIKTAVEIIDNFISGSRGLVTEDNSASILAKFVPLSVAAQHGVAETANTDILAADITPTNTPCLFRIMVMLEVAGVFSTMLKNGGATKKLKHNSGVALTADCAYMFDVLVHSGDTVNFQTDQNGNVTLRVQEIVAGVQ